MSESDRNSGAEGQCGCYGRYTSNYKLSLTEAKLKP